MASDDTGVINDILNKIGAWLANVLSKVGDYLWQQFQPVFDKIASWLDVVYGKLSDIIGNLQRWLSDLVDNIRSFIESAFSGVVDFLTNLYNNISNSITSLFDTVVEYFQSIYDTVLAKILGAYEQVATWFADIVDWVKSALLGIVDNVKTYLQSLYEDIRTATQLIIESVMQVVQALGDAIKTFIDSVVDVVGSSLRSLMEVVAELPDRLTELGTSFNDAIDMFVGQPLGDMGLNITTALADKLNDLFGGDGEKIESALEPLMSRSMTPEEARNHWQHVFGTLLPSSPTARAIFNTFIGLFMIMRVGGGVADANAQIVLQEFGYQYPYNLPPVPDVINLKHYNIVNEDKAIDLIRKQGYSAEHAQQLIQGAETVAPEGELIAWWLRGFIDDEQLATKLQQKGYSNESIKHLKQGSEVLPPVPDIITMAVREVFSPDVAARFGQFDDFPEEFAKWAKKQGLNEEWAKNYWASHWALPSVQMGFEMLHRRVIGRDDLELLLRAADVMPFWRDKLIDISYSPLTRVDVRRMHKMGVINDDETFDAYRDLGYDDINAARMLEFTIEYNREAPAEDDNELTQLSRASIVGFYEDGLLARSEAAHQLIELGYSPEAAELYLLSVDLQSERQQRKETAGLIVDQVKAGLISFDQAQDALSGAGLETRELTRDLTQIVRLQVQKTKLPSKADLDKFVASGIIDKNEYLTTLVLIGYSELWADRYYTLLTGE